VKPSVNENIRNETNGEESQNEIKLFKMKCHIMIEYMIRILDIDLPQ